MIRTIVVLLMASMLASCAVKPAKTVPVDYKYDENVKIGFVSLISERPTHSHVGITVFNSFTKDMDVQWKLNDHIFNSLSEEFQKKGYRMVDLSANPSAKKFLEHESLVVKKGEFTDVNANELNKIIDGLGVDDLDAVVVVSSHKVFYNKNFERIRESMGAQGDHGFMSRTGEGMAFHSSIGIRMFTVKPTPHYVGWQYLGLIGQKVVPQPRDHANLTSAELSAYEQQLKNNIDAKVREFVSITP